MSRNQVFQTISQIFIHTTPGINSARSYSRWFHRKPAKVLLPYESGEKTNFKTEKIIDLNEERVMKTQESKSSKSPVMKDKEKVIKSQSVKTLDPPKIEATISKKFENLAEKRVEKLKRHKFYLNQQKVFDENNEIIFEKLKDNDARVSTLLMKFKSKKERARCGQTLVEGWRLIVDGLEAKCKLNYVIFSKTEDLNKIRPFLPEVGVKLYKVPYKEIEMWSDVETSPGIVGIFQTPTADQIKRNIRTMPMQFICDNIRVPGNLGAILRAAMGVGCEKVILTKGCVDVWDPKVIRSAAGAHFRLPIQTSVEWNEITTLIKHDTGVFVADNNTTVEDNPLEQDEKFNTYSIPILPYYGVDYASFSHTTLIIGGETEGISEESYMFAAERRGIRLNIPMERGVDSLNTGMATAVIAFEIRKQMIQAWRKIKQENESQIELSA